MGAENVILEYLQKHGEGASTSDISEETGHTRATVAKYLEMLKLRGKVDYREVGKAKLWVLAQNRKKILIAEDESHIRRLIAVILGNEDYELMEAADGLEALEKVSDTMPDLVILDIMMPKMDGMKVCQQIKSNALTRKIPVIMLTAKREMSDKITGIKSGADDYLTKPFEPGELRTRVKTFLESKASERNPVTKLPALRATLEKIKKTDLDIFLISFKNLESYRKEYGFSKSDELLRIASQIINHCLERLSPDNFVGHYDESSFLVAMEKSNSASIVREIENEFESSIPFFYNLDYENIDFGRGVVSRPDGKKTKETPIVRMAKMQLKKEDLDKERLAKLVHV